MVSVCIAAHNGECFIREQLESILPQLAVSDEIIVSDDGSTDKTLKIIEELEDSRIKIHKFHQPVNTLKSNSRNMIYASRNFENALKHATGDVIFLCDQDDIWYPNKLSVMLNALETADIVKHDLSVIDAKGNLIKDRFYNTSRQENRHWIHLVRYLPFRGCCMAFRRKVLESSLPFPKTCLQHDSWIGMVAKAYKFKFAYIDQPLLFHRIHDGNVSELEKPNSIAYQISYRMKLLFQLLMHKILYKSPKHKK